jgi:hypothetical protein
MMPSYRLEVLLFKLEILDHKVRERAGAITPTFIGPIPVLLQLDTAMEVKLHAKWQPYTIVTGWILCMEGIDV